MFDLKSYLDARRRLIDPALDAWLDDEVHSGQRRLVAAMRYCLMAGGKRIRPVLCMAAAEAVGSDAQSVLQTACAIEMIHTYSLIHDDLPGMDDDRLRRGKPTCHVAFDEATAILAGDGLLTLAFEVLTRCPEPGEPRCARQLQAARALARAAGHRGMIEGQMQDMAAEGRRLDLSALESLHALKTGALIRAAVYTGALLGGGSEAQIRRLEAYAASIGLAFQVVDDILNVTGDPQRLGKAVGTDAQRGKNTYPALLGVERATALARELVDRGLQALSDFGKSADPLRAVATYIIERSH